MRQAFIFFLVSDRSFLLLCDVSLHVWLNNYRRSEIVVLGSHVSIYPEYKPSLRLTRAWLTSDASVLHHFLEKLFVASKLAVESWNSCWTGSSALTQPRFPSLLPLLSPLEGMSVFAICLSSWLLLCLSTLGQHALCCSVSDILPPQTSDRSQTLGSSWGSIFKYYSKCLFLSEFSSVSNFSYAFS